MNSINLNNFINESSGIIHVGSASGRECHIYSPRPVIFVEARRDAWEQCKNRCSNYPHQFAINALITDKDGQEYDFNISSNRGLSSSIYKLEGHKELWPNVKMSSTSKLTSKKLDTIMEHFNKLDYDTLVIDTQGSELLVLKGADKTLNNIRFIKVEAADFEAYRGCCKVEDIDKFLTNLGFKEIDRQKMDSSKENMNYFDLLYYRELPFVQYAYDADGKILATVVFDASSNNFMEVAQYEPTDLDLDGLFTSSSNDEE